MAARLLALVLAVGMVMGAIALRNRWDDDGGNGGDRSGVVRLTCAPELEEPCRALEDDGRAIVTVEDAGVTADKLIEKGTAGLDAWMTPGPWPQLVDEARRAAGRPPLFRTAPAELARTHVGLVVWNDRAAALRGRCGEELRWRCLGEVAGQPWTSVGGQPTWGAVKPALPNPVSSATGLAALAAATKGFFAPSAFSLRDLEENDDFRGWLAALAGANRSVELSTVLAQGQSAADAVAVLEALALPLINESARAGQVRLIDPAPVTTVEVVLGALDGEGDRVGALARDARTALGDAGWSTGPVPDTGLGSPGLLQALRQMWAEAR